MALFVERARAVKSSFVLDATNADAVSQVCRRLDGIALAIELAAARVAMLTPAEVARRLDQRFRLLGGGQRTAVERHQTLRAAIDWSYELLSETEQLLLDRLSIFVGGFSLEDAEAVTADGAIEGADVFELLATLVARSLVVADTDGDETRYRLPETIRQYAQERLDGSGDGDRLRAVHAAYFAGFAEAAITNATGPDGAEWERRFEREFDNVRAALTWATDTQDVDTALRLVAVWDAPINLWDVALISTTVWAAQVVLAISGASEHPKYPAALAVTAWIATMQSDQELARRRCDEAVIAEQRLGTEPSILIWNVLANSAQAQGNRDEAVKHARHCVKVARARGDDAWQVQALASSALSHALAGYPAEALTDAEETLALTHRIANPRILSSLLSMVAFALGESEPQRALVIAREAVALIPSGEHNTTHVFAGDLAARNGDHREAVGYFAKAIESFHWMGWRLPVGLTLGYVGVEIADDDPEAAAVLFGVCDALAPDYAHAPHFVEALAQANVALETTLGTARREELYAQGMKMSDIDAVDYGNAAITRFLSEDTA
ncbi:MAG: tetratricopeptide repeat protein [Acidimicrobiia bacterium]